MKMHKNSIINLLTDRKDYHFIYFSSLMVKLEFLKNLYEIDIGSNPI